MGLESSSKKRSVEAGKFGYEGLKKETWEGYPSYLGGSNGASQLREAEEIRKILDGITLPIDDVDRKATSIDKKVIIDEQQAEALVNAMANGIIDVDGNQINNSVSDFKPKQMGFSAFQMLSLVSFVFSGLILATGIIVIVFMK